MLKRGRHRLSNTLSVGVPLVMGVLLLTGWGVVPHPDAYPVVASGSIEYTSGPYQSRSDTLHIGIVFSGNFFPLPPALLPNGPESWIMSQVYGPGLILPSTKTNGNDLPQVALACGFTEGVVPGTTFFTVKEGVRFHDNSQLTLADIKATFERYQRLAEDDNPAIDSAFKYINSIEIEPDQNRLSVVMPDGMKVQPYRIATVAPLAPALGELSRLGVDEEPIGLGGYTYRLVTEPTGAGVARRGVIYLRAFEGYFEGSPEIKNIAVHLYPNDRELIQAFITGDVHVARLPTHRVTTTLKKLLEGSRLERNSLVRMYPRPNHFFFLAFNNARFPFNITGVRSALARAIDRNAMADEPPFASVITDLPVHPRSSLGRSGHSAYLPTAAKRMLQETGLLRRGEPTDRTGQPIRLSLIYPDHVSLYEEMALQIKNDLQRIGFRIDAEPVSPEIVRKRLREGDYSLAISEMTLPPTPGAIRRLFYSTNAASGLNFSRYRNLTFNTSIDAVILQRVPNPESYLDSAVRLLGDEFPLLPLFFQANEYYVFNNSIVDPNSVGRVLSRLEPIAKWKWR